MCKTGPWIVDENGKRWFLITPCQVGDLFHIGALQMLSNKANAFIALQDSYETVGGGLAILALARQKIKKKNDHFGYRNSFKHSPSGAETMQIGQRQILAEFGVY